MSASPGPHLEALDLYLDGELVGEQLKAFQAELARDPELRRQVELHERMSGSLKRSFAPPAGISVPPEVAAQLASGSVRERLARRGGGALFKRLAMYAAAAVLALAGVLVFDAWRGSAKVERRPGIVVADAMYTKLVDAGFKPEWKCKDDAEFAKAVRDRLGQPLLVAQGAGGVGPGVEILGWAYAAPYDGTPMSSRAMILLTTVDSRQVVLVIDDKKADIDKVTTDAKGGLKLFRREVGSLVAYEISPLSEPRILEKLYRPDR